MGPVFAGLAQLCLNELKKLEKGKWVYHVFLK
jgi:hypothetical protein